MTDDGEDMRTLRARAEELRSLASEATVMAGSVAERDVERVRAEIDGAILAIDEARMPASEIAGWLRSSASTLESAVYMSGFTAAGAPSVLELQRRITAWIEAREKPRAG